MKFQERNTLNAHQKVIDHLKAQRPCLQEVKNVDECDFILVFCPVVSRAGTDIEEAVNKLQKELDTKPAVLVVLHHMFDRDCVVPDSSRAVKRKNSITIDCLFHEDQGLLQCHKNNESLDRITNIIKSQESWRILDYMPGCITPWNWFYTANSTEVTKQEKDETEKIQALKMNENDFSEVRLVVLGKKDSGKSSAKNTILRKQERNQAAASTATSSSTQYSESTQEEVAGRKVTVVDTPDWFSSRLSLEKRRKDVEHCVQLSKPGPHAFLLVIPVKHSEEKVVDIKEELNVIEEIFGEQCFRHTMILFTLTDESQKTEKLIQSGDQRFVEKYGNRFHFLNSQDSGDGSQVLELLEKIKEMVGGSSEKFYSSEIYLKTLARIGETEKKMNEQKDEEKKRKLEQEQAEELDQSINMEQNANKTKENTEIAIQEVHEEEVNMEAKRNEMNTEIWRSVLTSSMKMQEEIEEKDRDIKKLKQQFEESDRQLKEKDKRLEEKDSQLKKLKKDQYEMIYV